MTTITADDIRTARTLSGRRTGRAYADQWHRAIERQTGGRVADAPSGLDADCANATPVIRAIADALLAHPLAARAPRWLARFGYDSDEAHQLHVNGRRVTALSSLPPKAGEKSHALSLAIELVATLDEGEHAITLGNVWRASEYTVAA